MSKCNVDLLLMQENNPALVGTEYFLCRPMAALSGRVLHGLWSTLPLEARLLPTLTQARLLCLTNTRKPPRVASHYHSEDLCPGCLSSWGTFFPNIQAEIPALQEQFLARSFS